jgi:broad specificity phosphatase PhoE
MNEYLAKPGQQWGDPHFTDIFPASDLHLYLDTPLSPRGIAQAEKLSSAVFDKYNGERIHLSDMVQLVVVSPLKRALQTAQLGILPHLNTTNTPFVALPLASERLYLVSDMGSPIPNISPQFPFVDFHTGFEGFPSKDEWWYTHKGERYEEWRPCNQGQRYFCRGEPMDHFSRRMEALYDWLHHREESVIALVCHYGVIEHLTGGEEFENCEIAAFPLRKLSRSGVQYVNN